ncbi:SNARE associated protein [Toxoplasma gondii VEG]|uniref:SNARE associated protein n=2 Tax=Toxoplasma gondii TaxID=5811 RepID=V4YYZ1_TOXGV|nr:SNARE associated protein [Toxoplasma gondii VEG]
MDDQEERSRATPASQETSVSEPPATSPPRLSGRLAPLSPDLCASASLSFSPRSRTSSHGGCFDTQETSSARSSPSPDAERSTKRSSSSRSTQVPLSPQSRKREELPTRCTLSSTPLLANLPPLDAAQGSIEPPRVPSPSWQALLEARAHAGTLEISGTQPRDQFLVNFIFAAKILAVVLAAVLIVSAFTHLEAVGVLVNTLLAKVQALGPWSPFAFVLMYVALVIFMVPAEALNVAGGFIFSRIYGCFVGVPLALCCSMTSLTTAGSICFLLSRHVCSKHVEKLFRGSDIYYAFQLAVEDGGTCFVALIRLSPILPYSITSYLFGLTSLRLSQLVVGSFSSVPLVFIFNCVGAALRDIDNVDFGRLHLSWQKALLGLFGLATATVRGFMGKVDFSQRRRIEPMRHKEGAHVFQT